jgi:hypothetical protein
VFGKHAAKPQDEKQQEVNYGGFFPDSRYFKNQ